MLADYGTIGLTAHAHPLALLRDRLPDGVATSRELERLRHGTRVKVGGLVVARQRPGTANGIVFVLLEDEFGTINLIVPPPVYERHRLTVRTEPLMIAEGKLERHAGGGRRDQHPGRPGPARSRPPIVWSPRSRTSRCSTNRCAGGWLSSERLGRARPRSSMPRTSERSPLRS